MSSKFFQFEQKMENSQRPMLLFLGIYIFSMQWILAHQQVNVALGGIATQSSVFNYCNASFAIDGIKETDARLHSCSHTKTESNPWWRVDLLAVYNISNVSITNRGDCCPERINGAEIHIGSSLISNGNNNPSCAVIASMPAGASVNYTCNMQGRYVNIFIPIAGQILTLCEVEVYVVSVPVTKKAFLKLKFNSNEDLRNPTVRDTILQKIKSANVYSSVVNVRWTKEPQLEIKT
ncbi:fucolectin-like [Tachysurus fulvidraco]|uniref:fucolectin-like n=1 Tax=Tachysurus fulvidraco TaxID=1234273 RepID=UPI001FEF0AE3|nr:fucolectin-like [Tachysurus fulvidraco]